MVSVGIAAVVIIIILLVWRLWGGQSPSENSVYWYEFQYEAPINLVIISGMHGNEPAGSVALTWLCDQMRDDLIGYGYLITGGVSTNVVQIEEGQRSKPGTITIIPSINVDGLRANRRLSVDGFDLNRSFGPNGIHNPLGDMIWQICSNADLVLDFHEGWGYHRANNISVGSTLSSTPLPWLSNKCREIVDKLNSKIVDSHKKFTYLPELFCDIDTAMACQCYRGGVPYVLIETTGQNNIQPIEVRANQILLICDNFFNYFVNGGAH